MTQIQFQNSLTGLQSKLYYFALSLTSDSDRAQDLVQETFLSAWKAKDSFRGEASEKSWLFTICKNKIIDHYQKKAKEIVQPSV